MFTSMMQEQMRSGCVPDGRIGDQSSCPMEEGDIVNEILKVVLVGIFTTIVAAINKAGES